MLIYVLPKEKLNIRLLEFIVKVVVTELLVAIRHGYMAGWLLGMATWLAGWLSGMATWLAG